MKEVGSDDDTLFEAAMEQAISAFGEEVKTQVAARRAKGLPDPVIDMSPARQKKVMARLQEEIERCKLSSALTKTIR